MATNATFAFSKACDENDMSAAASEISQCLNKRGEISADITDKLSSLASDPENNAFITQMISNIPETMQQDDSIYSAIEYGASITENADLISALPQLAAADDLDDFSYPADDENIGADAWNDGPSHSPFS